MNLIHSKSIMESVLRQGVLLIPTLYLMHDLFGLTGIAAAHSSGSRCDPCRFCSGIARIQANRGCRSCGKKQQLNVTVSNKSKSNNKEIKN